MRCAALTVLKAFCEGNAEIPFGCLRDRAPGKAADTESERLSAAGSMSGMTMVGISQGLAPGSPKGAGAPSVGNGIGYHIKTFEVSKDLG